ncbi:hypothetical protein [Kiloniella sp.]|uniref:hypothetical protein n=1 Tax=Kiloniella sp. TaxID=1938587 RepID=UPI003B01F01D
MLKDFQKIYKLLKSSRKFDSEQQKSPRVIDNHSIRSSDTPDQYTDEPTTINAPSDKQQSGLLSPSNEIINAEIQKTAKVPSFLALLRFVE